MVYVHTECSGGSASSVSWDHFFDSLIQYYASMRQESPAVMEHVGVPFRPPPVRTITPQELEGLCAVLKLTRTIAEQVAVIVWSSSLSEKMFRINS